jgi:hypothetical protein
MLATTFVMVVQDVQRLWGANILLNLFVARWVARIFHLSGGNIKASHIKANAALGEAKSFRPVIERT